MAKKFRVLVVEARYYDDVADELIKGAAKVMAEAGCSYDRVEVPGVFEVPGAIRFHIDAQGKKRRYDGYLALGCVIRGETDHYDHICRESSRAIMDIATDGHPIGFGILTCPSYKHAMARASVDKMNKGAEVARACLRMMELRRELKLAK